MNIDAKNIQDGFYSAKPTCCGLILSKNGHEQFAIEVAIEIEGQDESVLMTTFGGLDSKPIQRQDGSTTTSLEITMDQAEACGVDTSLDIRKWNIDSTREVRVKIAGEEYNGTWTPKLRGIYPPGGGGGLIRKQAMDDTRAAAVASRLNSHIAALRAKRGTPAAAPAPKPTSKPAQRQASKPANGGDAFKGEAPDYNAPDDSDIPF
jgi:hypothetical protein